MSKNIIIIDLDDTLFTTFQRKWLAFRNLEKAKNIPLELNAKKVAHSFGFEDYIEKNKPKTLNNLPKDRLDELKNYWFSLFISEDIFSKYLKTNGNIHNYSQEIRNYLIKEQTRTKILSEFISGLIGFEILYLSGRPESLYHASVEELRIHGFPIPNGLNIKMMLKQKEESDLEFKHNVFTGLDLDRIFCIFEDNEEIILDILGIFRTQNKETPLIYRNIPPYRKYINLGENVYSDIEQFRAVLHAHITNSQIKRYKSDNKEKRSAYELNTAKK